MVSDVRAALDTIDAFTGLGFIPDALVGFYGPVNRAWECAAGAVRLGSAPSSTCAAASGQISGIGDRSGSPVGQEGLMMTGALLAVKP